MNIAANLPLYPAYKPSGVEWLGDVPAHWEVRPNRSIFVEVNDQNHPDEQMLSSYYHTWSYSTAGIVGR